MGADLSRVRFDARADINKVVQQQGRLLLDADCNEQARPARPPDAGASRRTSASLRPRSRTSPGRAVVPRTTPDGFKLSLGAGALMHRPRTHVRRRALAENHGTGPSSSTRCWAS